jgi:hypothetical protein
MMTIDRHHDFKRFTVIKDQDPRIVSFDFAQPTEERELSEAVGAASPQGDNSLTWVLS